MNRFEPADSIGRVVRIVVDCDACTIERNAGVDVPCVRAAEWAVVLRDCCRWSVPVQYLVCSPHWLEILTQALPVQCSGCGARIRTIGDVVDRAMTLGATLDDVVS